MALDALQMAIDVREPDAGLLHHSDRGSRYAPRKEAEADIFKYIELFYNRKRKHAASDYLSPVAFEELYQLSTVDQAA